ncbi:hypothetical protein RCL1_007657 [Eukaryota sp. TZLM3-RCL]
MPELSEFAMKVIFLVMSSSDAERVWSAHDFFVTKRRNKLSLERANKLISIHFALKLAQARDKDATAQLTENIERENHMAIAFEDVERLKMELKWC